MRPAPALLSSRRSLAGLHAYFTRLVDDALQGACLVTRTLMELAEQDEELHLRCKAIYGELGAISRSSCNGQRRWGAGARAGHPTLTAFLQVNIQGSSPSPSATPTLCCWRVVTS